MPENQPTSTPAPIEQETKEKKKPGPKAKENGSAALVPPAESPIIAPEADLTPPVVAPIATEEKQKPTEPPPVTADAKKEEKPGTATTPVPSPPKVLPEMDKSKSHQDRIVAYLASRKGTIKLNDFLKSLYSLPQPGHPAEFTSQPVMKKLKADLKALRDSGKVQFVNDSFEKLAKAHFPDQSTGKTHYWDITNTPIEVVIP